MQAWMLHSQNCQRDKAREHFQNEALVGQEGIGHICGRAEQDVNEQHDHPEAVASPQSTPS